jgi:hypothetical protein
MPVATPKPTNDAIAFDGASYASGFFVDAAAPAPQGPQGPKESEEWLHEDEAPHGAREDVAWWDEAQAASSLG